MESPYQIPPSQVNSVAALVPRSDRSSQQVEFLSSRTYIAYDLRVLNELEDPGVSSALSLIGGDHIGARALHVLNLIWFGCIARLSQRGGG
jgi:hypothetical protein